MANGIIFYDAEKIERGRTICSKKGMRLGVINRQNTKHRNLSNTNFNRIKRAHVELPGDADIQREIDSGFTEILYRPETGNIESNIDNRVMK